MIARMIFEIEYGKSKLESVLKIFLSILFATLLIIPTYLLITYWLDTRKDIILADGKEKDAVNKNMVIINTKNEGSLNINPVRFSENADKNKNIKTDLNSSEEDVAFYESESFYTVPKTNELVKRNGFIYDDSSGDTKQISYYDDKKPISRYKKEKKLKKNKEKNYKDLKPICYGEYLISNAINENLTIPENVSSTQNQGKIPEYKESIIVFDNLSLEKNDFKLVKEDKKLKNQSKMDKTALKLVEESFEILGTKKEHKINRKKVEDQIFEAINCEIYKKNCKNNENEIEINVGSESKCENKQINEGMELCDINESESFRVINYDSDENITREKIESDDEGYVVLEK